MQVYCSRDSVANGDDDYLSRTASLSRETPVLEIVESVAESGFLPQIHGGKATWSVVSGVPVAVVAQEWDKPQRIPWHPIEISELDFAASVLRLQFNYHAQIDPAVVLRVLKNLRLHAQEF